LQELHGDAPEVVEAESSSSSDEPDVIDMAIKATGKRKRLLKSRGKKRLRKALKFMSEVEPRVAKIWGDVPTYLELASLNRASLEQYLKQLGLLSSSSLCCSMAPQELDKSLSQWMNRTFAVGHRPWQGEKALAALLAFTPTLVTTGMPRSWRALKGWRKLSPGCSKRPRVYAIWAALATDLARRLHWRMAIGSLIALALYLRIKELVGANCGQLIAPTRQGLENWCLRLHPQEANVRSKVGLFDENLEFASPHAKFLVPALKWLQAQPPDTSILGCSSLDYVREMKTSARRLGMSDLVASEARHSGASIDVAKKFKTLEQCQKLGRWQSLKSMRRYEKAGELARSWTSLSQEQRDHFEECERRLAESLFQGRFPPEKTFVAQVASAFSRTSVRSRVEADTVTARSKRRTTSS
jgi:hypothetical protein